ncbi:hypothetical protein [Pseudosporangium ferrugineum]|uniref:Uncharacterized protein n=1 Tax=Pseudosporangium ferrugineum TaxID=439699 RepID=A0A2T0S8Z0_9ACTN|nr:hypothetical protein [Pseudosporangium ferrugineum]PRY29856.1 hypothetical protein CLV70_10524 [Pseudosporangium ferrugineum]
MSMSQRQTASGRPLRVAPAWVGAPSQGTADDHLLPVREAVWIWSVRRYARTALWALPAGAALYGWSTLGVPTPAGQLLVEITAGWLCTIAMIALAGLLAGSRTRRPAVAGLLIGLAGALLWLPLLALPGGDTITGRPTSASGDPATGGSNGAGSTGAGLNGAGPNGAGSTGAGSNGAGSAAAGSVLGGSAEGGAAAEDTAGTRTLARGAVADPAMGGAVAGDAVAGSAVGDGAPGAGEEAGAIGGGPGAGAAGVPAAAGGAEAGVTADGTGKAQLPGGARTEVAQVPERAVAAGLPNLGLTTTQIHRASVAAAAVMGVGWLLLGWAVLRSKLVNPADGVLLILAAVSIGAGSFAVRPLPTVGALLLLAAGMGLAWTGSRLIPAT